MKTILITGANKGVGFETARQLAQLGNFIYLGSRDIKNGQRAVEQLKAEGIDNVTAIQIDVTDVASIERAKAEIEKLDVLINNAGIAGEIQQRMCDSSMNSIRALFDTNFFGAIQTTQVMLPLLRKSTTPAIVNISSEVGSLSMHMSPGKSPHWNNISTYGATKAALNAFTVMLANELREENILVNSVTPGPTQTDLNYFKVGKTVAEGAQPIVALVMQSDRGVTGRFFKDGGEVAW